MRRKSVYDMMQRMGTPLVVKHRFNDVDRQTGSAARVQDVAPDLADDVYEQTRNFDPLSYGTGFVGAINGEVVYSDDEFFDPNWTGFDTQTLDPNDVDTSFIWRKSIDGPTPPDGYIPAPKYRGYGQGSLVYIILPDRAEDYYKANVGGPLFKVQEAYAIAPWYPDINDNDLLIAVEVGKNGQILNLDGYGRLPKNYKYDRFEAKMTNPISMRSHDRGGLREASYSDTWGNRFIVNQAFEMDLLPVTDISYDVEIDR